MIKLIDIKAYWKSREGSAAIETAFVTPVVVVLFFFCIQLLALMMAQVTLQMGVTSVVGEYEDMYIKEQTPLSEIDAVDLLCEKMIVFGNCEERLSIQLHSYSSTDVSLINQEEYENNWTALEDYYVSFVRVDYKVPNIIPYFSTIMRTASDDFVLSSVFIVTPTKIRDQSA